MGCCLTSGLDGFFSGFSSLFGTSLLLLLQHPKRDAKKPCFSFFGLKASSSSASVTFDGSSRG
jgi:hypothetical protein